jgi:RNA polymerase sigma-70 factor, ECF subfamily
MTATADRLVESGSLPVVGRTSSSELTPRQVAEQGARFVPSTLRYLGVPEGVVLDAAQDVFLVALRRLDDFEGRSTLTTWLYAICVRVAHGYRRRRHDGRESLVESLPEVASPAQQEAALECAEWQQQFDVLLDELDESQRAVFVLYEIQHLSMKEVAEALGCPVKTAYYRHKSARSRILDGFRRCLETEGA